MTSINVAKGLFRVWVLFALCWVVPVTFSMFDALTATASGYYEQKWIVLYDQIHSLPPSNASNQQTEKRKFDPEKPFYTPKFDPDRLSAEKAKSCKEATNIVDLKDYCSVLPRWGVIDEAITIVTVPIWSKRIYAAEWIILPPLVLLLLGYGVLWAVRGVKA